MGRAGAAPYPASPGRRPDFVELGARFDEALLYAATAHRHQSRKGTAVPYLSHLLGVASIVLTYGGSEEQAIAGLLHDTVEDCGVSHEPVIAELFGDDVLRMVLACTDARVEAGRPKADWRTRKEAYLHHLAELPSGDPARLISAADKLHNATAILADLESLGLALWSRFPGRTPADHLWYYDALATTFEHTLAGPLPARLRATVSAIAAVNDRLAGGGLR